MKFKSSCTHCFARLRCIGEKKSSRYARSAQPAASLGQEVNGVQFSSLQPRARPLQGPLNRLPPLPVPSTGCPASCPALGPSPCGLGSTLLSKAPAPETGSVETQPSPIAPSLGEACLRRLPCWLLWSMYDAEPCSTSAEETAGNLATKWQVWIWAE